MAKKKPPKMGCIPVESPILLSDKLVGVDTNRSPQIHLDLEQNRTGHDSFPKL
jgi:hypothetical protein